jgi:apolipoprotein N-acyltransferase
VLSKANTKKQYFFSGWVFGIGLFGAGASWPFYSMYYFAHAPLALALLGTFLFVTIIASLTTGVFGLLASLFRYKPLFARLLLFYPSTWVLVEWTRSWFLTGFPWLYLGNSQIDTYFASYAPITGVLGVSLISVLISGAFLSFLFGSSARRMIHLEHDQMSQSVSDKVVVEESFSASIRLWSALIIVLLVGTSFVLQKIDWTEKRGKPLKVSVLQSNISQQDKLNPQKLSSALTLYKDMTKKSHSSDLIVWPETSLFDIFGNHMDNVILPLQESLAGSNKAILIGGFFINKDGGVENSVLALSADNRELYSKRHLVPFGEYIPLIEYVNWLGDWIPRSNIDSGINDGMLSVAGETAQMTICYEDAFGAEVIQSLPQSTLLINVTHDGWFTGSLELAQHMQIARMRALETGRYMVRATTTGPSGIINEKGRVLVTAPLYTKKIITGNVQPFEGATPYVRWGNWLVVSILSLILILGLIFRRK